MAYDLGTYGAELVITDTNFTSSLNDAEQKINKADGKFKLFGANLGTLAVGAVAGVGAALVGAGVAGTKMANDIDVALRQLQSATGATDEEMKAMEESIENIYNLGFGENLNEVAQAMANVKQNTGLAGEELESLTKDAMTLAETFDMDVNESSRTAKAMIEQFGISGEQAMNLIAQGAQNGANKNGDLLDSLNEYGNQFASLGFSAEQFTNVLIDGAENGAFSIDKVGDAIKEFNIRAKDGSDSTIDAFKSLGFNAAEMSNNFAEGGEKAQQSFSQVMNALNDIDDPLEKNRIGVQLFGTMFEDLEAKGIEAFANIGDTASITKDSLGEIQEIRFESFSEGMQVIGRTLQTSMIEPIQEHVLPLLSQFTNYIIDHMPQIQSVISTTFDAIGKVIGGAVTVVKSIISAFQESESSTNTTFSSIKKIVSSIIDTIKSIIGEFVKFATTIWSKYGEDIISITSTLWETISSVIGGVLEVIRGVVKTVLSLLTGDWKGAWEGIKTITSGLLKVIEGVIKTVTNNIQGIFKGTWAVLKNITSVAWEGIKTAITSPIQKAFDTVMGIIDRIKSAFSNLKITIPKPKIPKIDVDWKSFGIGDAKIKIPTFDISWNAQGGIADRAMLYGVGEAGKEAIIPLDNPTYMNPFADAVYKRIADNLKVNNNTNNKTENQEFNYNPTFNFEVKGNMDRKQMDQIADFTFNKLTGTLKRYGIV
ncbi:phage tail tape measure protein [Schinkia azotoformans]|uniref:phage tail tape measure protein n=1 Tax=Schinkia azotoformans TaxID=1454 RepID=UPI002DB63B0C|nr:phage tail tape measure protein [Schinkia azotoformans]MEC1768280.1 phage tail tape measure protein [Schinkia azotoformans]